MLQVDQHDLDLPPASNSPPRVGKHLCGEVDHRRRARRQMLLKLTRHRMNILPLEDLIVCHSVRGAPLAQLGPEAKLIEDLVDDLRPRQRVVVRGRAAEVVGPVYELVGGGEPHDLLDATLEQRQEPRVLQVPPIARLGEQHPVLTLVLRIRHRPVPIDGVQKPTYERDVPQSGPDSHAADADGLCQGKGPGWRSDRLLLASLLVPLGWGPAKGKALEDTATNEPLERRLVPGKGGITDISAGRIVGGAHVVGGHLQRGLILIVDAVA
mmetsp:Transcript_103841/g.303109  ORF Transcript_103841/g.303109 Transcript_103841/m.303109 type:complete len:268 (+) Transcript_103841:266-1069(+)